MASGKALLGLLVGKPKPGGMGPPGKAGGEGGAMDAKARAFKRMAAAVKSGDAQAGAHAFKEMYDICAASSDEDEMPDEEENPGPDEDEGGEEY